MDRSLFRYIWTFSKRDQLVIFAVVLLSLPFFYWSLELPKRIVNEAIQGGAFRGGKTSAVLFDFAFTLPSFMGGQRIELFPGFNVDQLGLLFGLSGFFLLLVLINGGFKYWINVAKGALGERMLRRLRFDLVALTLRFQPETMRTVKASETATMIKDEVEPIGGFIGDAYVQPVMLGTQALTAMTFILMQNIWLGIIAGSIVAVQFTIIPRLRRIQLRLGKERQILSRRLAGRVGEIVDGMEAVHVHDTTAWERAEMGQRLYDLFDLRFRLYKWKFMVKFLNNLLAQITPFFFYAVGGYFALRGSLDIGQLVAVIAAYRELPPPLKELIDWDQQRLDVQIKYDQVVQQFSPERLVPPEVAEAGGAGDEPLQGPIVLEDLSVLDQHGAPLVENLTFRQPLPARIALIGDGGPGPSVVARVLARRISDYGGRVTIGGKDLSRIPEAVVGRRMAYAGGEPVLFPGSLRDNLVYGLRRRPGKTGVKDTVEERRRRLEAKRTGNPVDSMADDWIDYAAAGVEDADHLDHRLLEILEMVGLRDNVYRFGLSGKVDLARYPDLAEKLVEARHTLRGKLEEGGMAGLVESFDPERYNSQATIGENLLFGVPVDQAFAGRGLAANPLLRRVLDQEKLTGDLVGLGARIAGTMTEIFRDLPSGHPLFEQFSFIAADDLSDYEDIVRRWTARGEAGMDHEDRTRLIALPLDYIEAKHRLGLVDEAFTKRILAGRKRFRDAIEHDAAGTGLVEFYDADAVCAAAPLRDNLLFGRVAHGVADARLRVTAAMTEMIDELGLRESVERVGLDYQIGPAGRLLSPPQRASVYLARGVVKNPDILILDGVFTAFGDAQAKRILDAILDQFQSRTVVAVLRDEAQASDDRFEVLARFEGSRAELLRGRPLDTREAEAEDHAKDERETALEGEAR